MIYVSLPHYTDFRRENTFIMATLKRGISDVDMFIQQLIRETNTTDHALSKTGQCPYEVQNLLKR